jgi:hypothetical protein
LERWGRKIGKAMCYCPLKKNIKKQCLPLTVWMRGGVIIDLKNAGIRDFGSHA